MIFYLPYGNEFLCFIFLDFENIDSASINPNFEQDRMLTQVEVERSLQKIEEIWIKLFDILIYHMNRGIESPESRKKGTD